MHNLHVRLVLAVDCRRRNGYLCAATSVLATSGVNRWQHWTETHQPEPSQPV